MSRVLKDFFRDLFVRGKSIQNGPLHFSFGEEGIPAFYRDVTEKAAPKEAISKWPPLQ
jgi:hypothetical protein